MVRLAHQKAVWERDPKTDSSSLNTHQLLPEKKETKIKDKKICDCRVLMFNVQAFPGAYFLDGLGIFQAKFLVKKEKPRRLFENDTTFGKQLQNQQSHLLN